MRQKVGPLFEAMSLNHFPECHEKHSLSACLCSTVILKRAEASQSLSSTFTGMQTGGSQSVVLGPAASPSPCSWSWCKLSWPIPELLNQEILRGGPAVYVVMSPLSKQVQGNLMLGRVWEPRVRPMKATGLVSFELRVWSNNKTGNFLLIILFLI